MIMKVKAAVFYFLCHGSVDHKNIDSQPKGSQFADACCGIVVPSDKVRYLPSLVPQRGRNVFRSPLFAILKQIALLILVAR